jgi:hypothetical protein
MEPHQEPGAAVAVAEPQLLVLQVTQHLTVVMVLALQ